MSQVCYLTFLHLTFQLMILLQISSIWIGWGSFANISSKAVFLHLLFFHVMLHCADGASCTKQCHKKLFLVPMTDTHSRIFPQLFSIFFKLYVDMTLTSKVMKAVFLPILLHGFENCNRNLWESMFYEASTI